MISFYKALIKSPILLASAEIDNNKKTLYLPIPHSKHVTEFFAVAGSTSKKVGAIGCYGLGTVEDPTAYIGQSVHIGNRVAQHVRGKVKTTKDFLTNIITTDAQAGRVTLWIMNDKTQKYLEENSISIDLTKVNATSSRAISFLQL